MPALCLHFSFSLLFSSSLCKCFDQPLHGALNMLKLRCPHICILISQHYSRNQTFIVLKLWVRRIHEDQLKRSGKTVLNVQTICIYTDTFNRQYNVHPVKMILGELSMSLGYSSGENTWLHDQQWNIDYILNYHFLNSADPLPPNPNMRHIVFMSHIEPLETTRVVNLCSWQQK